MFRQIINFGKARGWKYVEFRGAHDLSPTTPRQISYLGHTLDLTKGEKALYSGLRGSTRRNIKKAAARGVKVRISNDLRGVQEFFQLNCLTRKLHGLPPQPSSFFNEIHDRVISAGKGFVVLASHGGKNIAGSVFFHFGDKAIFKYGASNRKYQEMRANNLVMWEAIRWFANKGFNNLCLGRTELENRGLRQFKNGWRPAESQIQYFKFDLREGAFVPGKRKGEPAYAGLFRAMPMSVLNVIGSLFYRHMG
jgi:lipid II:glycine glycyltransferase (peptidoglycan interpeptide bridge formation enzyme)